MDKKSLMRMLSRLGESDQIKNITVQLQLEDKVKVRRFIENLNKWGEAPL